MGTHEVEVVDVVAETVHVGARFHAVAQLEPEVETSLPVPVHRTKADLHDGFRNRGCVAVPGVVHDVEPHCCCCWGMPRPSSPVTAAGTLLGWK